MVQHQPDVTCHTFPRWNSLLAIAYLEHFEVFEVVVGLDRVGATLGQRWESLHLCRFSNPPQRPPPLPPRSLDDLLTRA